MWCQNCGRELKEGANFCGFCGARISEGGQVSSQGNGQKGDKARTDWLKKGLDRYRKMRRVQQIGVPVGTALLILIIVVAAAAGRASRRNQADVGGYLVDDSASTTQESQHYTGVMVEEEELVPESDYPLAAVSGVEEAEVSKNENANVSISEYTRAFTSDNGYEIVATIRISDQWIRSTDSALMQGTWEALGGVGTAPNCGDISKGGEVYEDNSVLVYGSLSFENVTKNFDITEGSAQSIIYQLGLDATQDVTYTSGDGIKMYYSDGAKILRNMEEFFPLMESNYWGPVPFACCVTRVFTPNYPEGDPVLDAIVFSYKEFTMRVDDDDYWDSISFRRSW